MNDEVKMKKYIVDRLRERSTWIGLFALLTGMGINVAPDMQDIIIGMGLAASGLIGILTKDKQ